MVMKNIISVFILFGLLATVHAQSILNVSSPEEYRYLKEMRIEVNGEGDTISTQKTPIPYGFINPNDIIWAQVVWEVIDLGQKFNQPYYYSSKDMISNSPYSLFETLREGIERNEIRNIYQDEYFRSKVTWDEVKESFKVVRYQKNSYCSDLAEKDTVSYEIECKLEFKMEASDIRFIKVKGMWYIDKRLGELRYRLLGMAPMGPDLAYLSSDAAAQLAVENLTGGGIPGANTSASGDSVSGGGDDLFGGGGDDDLFSGGNSEESDDNTLETDTNQDDFQKKMKETIDNQVIKPGASKELFDLFWVFYPSARTTLNNFTVLNPSNLASKVTFDDMLNARKFHSVIYKVEDGFDRHVKDNYPDALEQLDYDRQFRDKVLSKENIMWNY